MTVAYYPESSRSDTSSILHQTLLPLAIDLCISRHRRPLAPELRVLAPCRGDSSELRLTLTDIGAAQTTAYIDLHSPGRDPIGLWALGSLKCPDFGEIPILDVS